MKLRSLIFLVFALFSFQSCSKAKPPAYQIGIDPSFYPLALNEQATSVFAFSDELLTEISETTHTDFVKVNLSWDNLIESLYLKKVDGIFSSAPPNLINQTKYSFSETFLKTGPVLIVPLQPAAISLKDLSGRIVAMGKTSEELDLMKNYPEIQFVFYDSIVDALNKTASGSYAACLIPILPAHAYIKDLYQKELMISSSPLTSQGLRLLTLKDQHPNLIKTFNKGVLKAQKSGEVETLITKWSLFQN
jgi:polar amino acid transport system substrate-binding protein